MTIEKPRCTRRQHGLPDPFDTPAIGRELGGVPTSTLYHCLAATGRSRIRPDGSLTREWFGRYRRPDSR